MAGTKKSVNEVPIIIPDTNTHPMLFRAMAPGPVASMSGKCPATVATDVMSTGLKRVPAASMIALSLS